MKWFTLVNFSGALDSAFRSCRQRGTCHIVMMEDEAGTPWLGHMQHRETFPPEARIPIPEGMVEVRDEMPDGWKIYCTTPAATLLNAWIAEIHRFEDLPRHEGFPV